MLRLVLIAGLIVLFIYSGAGGKIMDGLKALPPECSSALGRLSPAIAEHVCGGLGTGIGYIDRLTSAMGNYGTQMVQGPKEVLAKIMGFGNVEGLQNYTSQAMGTSLATSPSVQALASSTSALEAKIKQGVPHFDSTASAGEQMRSAMDDFLIGQRYLKSDNGSSTEAIPWLQQGAATPGYGVMSQISLGDIYSNGTGGVPANPSTASNYYTQALQSIATLESSDTPQAQQILQTLPGGSSQIKQQIQHALAQLKLRAH